MFGIKKKIDLLVFRLKWARLYKNKNGIIPQTLFPLENVSVGIYSYGELNVVSFNCLSKLSIGNYVSIAQNVHFILDADHYMNHISTYPFLSKILYKGESESFGKGDIYVEDDVWIGFGSTIMSGVKIGQGAVIAAGSVVTKDVPSYSIVAGIPAKIIKYRFSNDIIEELKKLDYSKLTKDIISVHQKELYEELVSIDQLSWFPKK